jgi:hypothetical protein
MMDDYYGRVEAQLATLTERGAHRRGFAPRWAAPRVTGEIAALGLAVLVALGIAAIFLTVGNHSRRGVSTPPSGATGSAPPLLHNFSRTAMPPVAGQVVCDTRLQPPTGRRAPSGRARIYERAGRFVLWARASGLKPNTRNDTYGVWLSGGPGSPRLIGLVRVVVGGDRTLAIEAQLPPGAARYYLLLITHQTRLPTTRPGATALQGFVAF